MALIAIVDDAEDVLEAFSYILRNEGFDVLPFSDSNSFVEKFHDDSVFRNELTLAILDLMIDELSGEQLLQMIRDSERGDEIQVMISSAKNEEFTKVKLLGLGADDYIDKTIGTQEMIARVKARVRNFDKGQEKRALESFHSNDDSGLQLDNGTSVLRARAFG